MLDLRATIIYIPTIRQGDTDMTQIIPYWRFEYMVRGVKRRMWVTALSEYAARERVLYREPLATHICLVDIIG